MFGIGGPRPRETLANPHARHPLTLYLFPQHPTVSAPWAPDTDDLPLCWEGVEGDAFDLEAILTASHQGVLELERSVKGTWCSVTWMELQTA